MHSGSQAAGSLVLHVGLHKTGTTYLQAVWRANREALAAQGVHFPGGIGEPSQRLAAYDLLGRRPGGAGDQRLPGQWHALTETVAGSHQPTVLLSEEGLSVATSRQAAAAVRSFPGREVHVLLTVRDLGRVLTSSWQEEVKRDHTWTWEEFVEGVKDPERRAQNPGRGFWRAQDLPDILARWGGLVPAGHLHVVTVPPPGAPRDLLLRRVAEVVGFDAHALTESPQQDNSSLGTSGTEVVRRLNLALGHRLNERQHSHVVNQTLVPVLASGRDAAYGLPEEDLPWVSEEATRQVAALRSGGCQVVGDLEDLVPRARGSLRRPDDATTEELLGAAITALAALAERHARLWWRRRKDDPPPVEPTSLRARWGSEARSVGYRTRRATAELADRNQAVAGALGLYLRATRRTSARRRGTALPSTSNLAVDRSVAEASPEGS